MNWYDNVTFRTPCTKDDHDNCVAIGSNGSRVGIKDTKTNIVLTTTQGTFSQLQAYIRETAAA